VADGLIFPGQGLEVLGQLDLGQRRSDLQQPLQAQWLGNGLEQVIDRFGPDGRQHRTLVFGSVQHVTQADLLTTPVVRGIDLTCRGGAPSLNPSCACCRGGAKSLNPSCAWSCGQLERNYR